MLTHPYKENDNSKCDLFIIISLHNPSLGGGS